MKHVCPVCGGKTFKTTALVRELLKVDEDGLFLAYVNPQSWANFTIEPAKPNEPDVVVGTDYENLWTCFACGAQGVAVPEEYTKDKVSMAASVMRQWVKSNVVPEGGPYAKGVIEDAVRIFGEAAVKAVLAASVTFFGKKCDAYRQWAAAVGLPDGIALNDLRIFNYAITTSAKDVCSLVNELLKGV